MELRNDLLLRVARGEVVERPPVWLMRQAGRILPQYRAIRAKLSGFKELVSTPELAAEVTIQPVDELNVDAAIIFSDILVIPEAMGLDYELIEKVGPRFPQTIITSEDVDRLLQGGPAAEKLDYVYDAVRLTKKELSGRVPLIGFAGAPWTLLCYMVEGGGSKTFSRAKRLLYREPALARRLLDKITTSVIAYLKLKIESGVDIVQIFDSWAGILSPSQYQTFAVPYIQRICHEIQATPKIVFAKGAWNALENWRDTDCQVVGLDWTFPVPAALKRVGPDKALQGNLDPCQLYAEPEEVYQSTQRMLSAFGSKHIANLGHGVYPDTPLTGVKAFVNAVKEFRYQAVSSVG